MSKINFNSLENFRLRSSMVDLHISVIRLSNLIEEVSPSSRDYLGECIDGITDSIERLISSLK